MNATQLYYARVDACRARLTAAQDAYNAARDAAVQRMYAQLRDEDRAAGRPTGPGSVQNRRCLAFDMAVRHDEAFRAARDELAKRESEYYMAMTPRAAKLAKEYVEESEAEGEPVSVEDFLLYVGHTMTA